MGRFAERRHRHQKNNYESSLSGKKNKNGYQKKSIQKKSLLIDEPPKKDIVKFLRRSQLMQLSQWSKWPSVKKKK